MAVVDDHVLTVHVAQVCVLFQRVWMPIKSSPSVGIEIEIGVPDSIYFATVIDHIRLPGTQTTPGNASLARMI